jgi:hypothetical protein
MHNCGKTAAAPKPLMSSLMLCLVLCNKLRPGASAAPTHLDGAAALRSSSSSWFSQKWPKKLEAMVRSKPQDTCSKHSSQHSWREQIWCIATDSQVNK